MNGEPRTHLDPEQKRLAEEARQRVEDAIEKLKNGIDTLKKLKPTSTPEDKSERGKSDRG